MKLVYRNNRFESISKYEEKDIPKEAGMRWDSTARVWYSTKLEVAKKLIEYADEECKKQIEKIENEIKQKIEESKATDIDIQIPAPQGLDYFGYQKAGISYASKRDVTLIADEMGLGKTVQAIGVINKDENIRKVLVICPAFLKLNWKNELEKWLVRPARICILNGKSVDIDADIVIANYDILQKHIDTLKSFGFDMVVVDEAHYIKNHKAKRTQAVIDLCAGIKKKIFLTGTPILNRPVELYTILKIANLEIAKNWYWYVKRYCDAYQTKYGWDVSGASNLDELQEKLRTTIMIRRLKKDVLADLPPKIRQVVEIPADLFSDVLKNEEDILIKIKAIQEQIAKIKSEKESMTEEAYKDTISKLRDDTMATFTELTRVRHETALKKVEYIYEYIDEIVESGQQIVIFTYHRDVAAKIQEKLKENNVDSTVITGEDSIETRQKAVDDFQNGKIRILITTMKALGMGVTLTAASTAIFAELDWTPAVIQQAEDRLHRIGQKNSVLIQHLVINNSIDSRLAKILIKKQEIIDKALNCDMSANEDEIIDIVSEL